MMLVDSRFPFLLQEHFMNLLGGHSAQVKLGRLEKVMELWFTSLVWYNMLESSCLTPSA